MPATTEELIALYTQEPPQPLYFHLLAELPSNQEDYETYIDVTYDGYQAVVCYPEVIQGNTGLTMYQMTCSVNFQAPDLIGAVPFFGIYCLQYIGSAVMMLDMFPVDANNAFILRGDNTFDFNFTMTVPPYET